LLLNGFVNALNTGSRSAPAFFIFNNSAYAHEGLCIQSTLRTTLRQLLLRRFDRSSCVLPSACENSSKTSV
jgi:hypothetical protein